MDLHFEGRQQEISRFIDALFASNFEDAVTADGWPRAMVRAGFELHRRTWNAERLAAAARTELQTTFRDQFPHQLASSITHIWPALPGAGLTPVLFGWLLGIPQQIRASRRGQNFAALVHQLASDIAPGRLTRTDDFSTGEIVVVSGSDETLQAVRAQLRPGQHLVGYGHRTSFALVLDSPTLDLDDIAQKLALDAVLWHQQGCFSVRGVIFCGDHKRKLSFAGALGNAIEDVERLLDATHLDDTTLGTRAQALGLARFSSPVCGRGIGWVQPQRTPHTGAQISPHVVTLHHIVDITELPAAVQIPPHQIQGVALAATPDDPRRTTATDLLTHLGATLICPPGELQSPPPEWPHDGLPNLSIAFRP